MKQFKEVFPTLTFEDRSLEELSKHISVLRVSTSKDFESLSIYIESDRLIDKVSLITLEKIIKNTLFPSRKINIKIFEKFVLSKVYTPKNLFDSYKESIAYELKNFINRYYVLFRSTNFSFNDNIAYMELEDTVFNRKGMEEFLRIMEKIFIERCGLRCNFVVKYTEKKEHLQPETQVTKKYYNENFVKKEESKTKEESFAQVKSTVSFLPESNTKTGKS